MTDSESADDTKSWPMPFVLDSEETQAAGTTSGRRRLSEVGDGADPKVPDETTARDRPAGRGRRLGGPAPRYLRAGPSGSGGADTAAGATSSRPRSGDVPTSPPAVPGPLGASSSDDLVSTPSSSGPVPRPGAPRHMTGRRDGATAAPDAAAPSPVAPSEATSGPVTSGPVTSEAASSKAVPSKAVPSEAVPSEEGPSGPVSSDPLSSDPVPAVSPPPVPAAAGVGPTGGSRRGPRRPPDLSGLQEMRVGSDDGRTPDWMARRIVESEAPGSAYELGKQRRWRRRKITVLRSRTNRRLVRRIDTWTVFKVSFMFYLLMVIIVLVAGVATWNVAQHLGFINDIQKSVRSLADDKTFVFRGKDAIRWAAIGGVALGLLGTLFNTVAAMLYNLLSDVIGGLQVIVVTEPD